MSAFDDVVILRGFYAADDTLLFNARFKYANGLYKKNYSFILKHLKKTAPLKRILLTLITVTKCNKNNEKITLTEYRINNR